MSARRAAREAAISEAVDDIVEHRAVIDQAKGVIMFVYDLDDDAAFEMLRWHSQNGNVKLRALAEQLMRDCRGLSPAERAQPSKTRLDRLLMTAHERIQTG